MKLSTIIVIVLRLYAIYWVVSGISALAAAIPIWSAFAQKLGPEFSKSLGPIQAFEYYGIPSLMIIVAVILWFFANGISARVVEGHETTLSFSSLTKTDLYHFAFVFLGLYFVLSSLYTGTQNAYRFFTYDFPLSENDPTKGRYLQPLLGSLVSVAGGLACLLAARKWTRLLLRGESSDSHA